MSQLQFASLLMIWILSVVFISLLIWFEFCRAKFTFGIFFSTIFLATFYFGFPITSTLVFYFGAQGLKPEAFMQALLLATCFYGIYHLVYKINIKFISNDITFCRLFNVTCLETRLTWMILMGIALTCLIIFFIRNGFLLFKLQSYCQISSEKVSGIALKRFFYFFIPSMLIIYFLQQELKRWLFFFLGTTSFGLLTYIVVGGTRANLIISFLIFLFIGMIRGWISPRFLIIASMLEVFAMFYLATERYGIDIGDNDKIFYSFLFFTRDTFSPWENLALLLQHYDQINFQWVAPIMRNFYAFIPRWLWTNRPEIVLNTANYFTHKILNNHSGLAISPTLVGSLIIMGGVFFVFLGAVFVGLIIKYLDKLYLIGITEKNRYKAAILQSFCFSTIFSIVVLIREGLDAFISHIIFFILVFSICLFLAKFLGWLFSKVGLISSI